MSVPGSGTPSATVFGGHRVVPVAVLDDASLAEPLAQALVDGGLPIVEVTLRTPAAEAALRVLAADGRLLVGAGTVRTAEQVERAVEAGARFVVSPGFSPAVVRRAQQLGVPVYPGVATATEIMAALDAGVQVLKLFPAQTIGGLSALKALAAPFPGVRFVPTGGITATSMGDYLAQPAVAAVGGTWITSAALLRARDFTAVTALSAQAVQLAQATAAGGNDG